ncbi:transmembrane protein 273 [Peromyscus eremicus]|uniref:transmembrane protein 273 n=1 Tax=Peromyscus eremicus TaxID=42410 RepID=UPI0027DB8FEF|nr:transmembrane protein 273 [Peromyscus eremicus]
MVPSAGEPCRELPGTPEPLLTLAPEISARSSRTPDGAAILLRGSITRILKDVGRAQVLAMDKSAEAAIDFKYAIIGTALGVAISAGFLALKIWMIRRHLSDNDSADLKNTPQDTILQKKRSPRDAQVIEL